MAATAARLIGLESKMKGCDDLEAKDTRLLDTTSSFIGSKYITYMEKHHKTARDPKHIPKVEVAIKVYSVRNIDLMLGTFDAEFTLMLDWFDPSLSGEKPSTVNLDEHFNPHIYLSNVITEPTPVGGLNRPKLSSDPCHVTLTQRYRATMRTTYCVRDFPFDHQYLRITVKSRTISDGVKWINNQSKAYVVLKDPNTWNGKKGHVCAQNADELADQMIVLIDGGSSSSKGEGGAQDMYHVQICVSRESQGVVVGIGLPILTIMIISFGVFLIDLDALPDRLNLIITNILTLVAVKWVLESKLPCVPYLTLADWYVVFCFLILIVQAVVCMVISLVFSSTFFDGTSAAYYINLFSSILLGISFVGLQLFAYIYGRSLNRVDELKMRRGLIHARDDAFKNDEICSPFPRTSSKKEKKSIRKGKQIEPSILPGEEKSASPGSKSGLLECRSPRVSSGCGKSREWILSR